jgi:hypothetical protein
MSAIAYANKLHEFIDRERTSYDGRDSNRFALSLGQAERYYRFMRIVYARHQEVAPAFMENTNKIMASGESGPVSPELMRLLEDSVQLGDRLHLELESYHLFGALFLDRIACFIEVYFGPPTQGRLQSHAFLQRIITEYAKAKALALPEKFAETVAFVGNYLTEYRNKEITHERDWRATYATMFDGVGETRIGKIRLYAHNGDRQVESKGLKELNTAVDEYVDQIVWLVEKNRERTQLERAK